MMAPRVVGVGHDGVVRRGQLQEEKQRCHADDTRSHHLLARGARSAQCREKPLPSPVRTLLTDVGGDDRRH
jgi:hypothetical protein